MAKCIQLSEMAEMAARRFVSARVRHRHDRPGNADIRRAVLISRRRPSRTSLPWL